MTTGALHKKLIIRLAMGWLILSVAIGSVVFILEVKKIDEFVVDLAVLESKSFTLGDEDWINSPDPEHRAILLAKSRQHIAMGHFIVVHLYGRDGRKILSVSQPGRESGEKSSPSRAPFKPDMVDYRTFYLEKLPAVQVSVPLLTRTGQTVGRFEGVYLTDLKTATVMKERIASSFVQTSVVVLITTMLLYPVIISLNRNLLKLNVDLSKANIGMLKVLGSAVAKRDHDTNSHNYRVTLYAVRLAESLGTNGDGIRQLMKGAFLHDLGKIGVSDAILLKPGKLSPDEFEIIKMHPRHGAEIISKYAWLGDAMDVVKHHHEKFNGSGYPSGLSGNDIPKAARIFAIADVFDALTSRRPYKEPLPLEQAIAIMHAESGVCCDPAMARSFGAIAPLAYREIAGADDQTLEKALDGLIKKYFPEGRRR